MVLWILLTIIHYLNRLVEVIQYLNQLVERKYKVFVFDRFSLIDPILLRFSRLKFTKNKIKTLKRVHKS